MKWVSVILSLLALVFLAACGTVEKPETTKVERDKDRPSDQIGEPRIVIGKRSLQCVPFARANSQIKIRGDAHTWWRTAAGRYQRGSRPKPGAVIVLKKTKRLRYGHVAVVKKVISSRRIIVSHANWLNRGRLHLDTPAVDVSKNNDWSRVRFWYVPGNVLGRRHYPAHGFILPPQHLSDLSPVPLRRTRTIN